MRSRDPGPLNSKICSISIPLTAANLLFKNILLHKNGRGADELLLKNVQ